MAKAVNDIQSMDVSQSALASDRVDEGKEVEKSHKVTQASKTVVHTLRQKVASSIKMQHSTNQKPKMTGGPAAQSWNATCQQTTQHTNVCSRLPNCMINTWGLWCNIKPS